MRETGARDVWQQFEFVDEDLVHMVHDSGGRVVAWTVNDIAWALELGAMGADALCTDDVPGVRAALDGN
jgi:glycerophosphoryl diester phosphodiesterase